MILLLYSATIMLSSSLLFFVQPMVGKMVLPLLGGTPAVWNTCMVFFQAALLAGYAYAHAATKWLGVRRHATIHLGLMLLACIALPISLKADAAPPPDGNPVVWLLISLAACAGIPFFVVASTAPLIQKWFERSGHPSAHDPYFLYSASNVGSLGALLGYPLLIEPHFALPAQTRAWSVGFFLLWSALAACCAFLLKSNRQAHQPAPESRERSIEDNSVCWRRRLHWIALAAVPSSLMLGVTTHVTTNVAAVPLLWVVPLAIYLTTFILVFARRTILPHQRMVQAFPYLVVLLGLLFFAPPQELGWCVIPLHLLAFFVAAMACHGELARLRPASSHLTEYYLWMSLGGVVGGMFNALLAPTVFSSIAEYPLAVVAACMLLPRSKQASARQTIWLDLAMPVGVGLIAAALVTGMKIFNLPVTYLTLMAAFFLPMLLCFQFKDRPLRYGLSFGAVLLVTGLYSQSSSGVVQLVERNFFGVKKVVVSPDGSMRLLAHGTTNHGCERINGGQPAEPMAYFHRNGPLGDVFAAVVTDERRRDVAVIGLGIGSIAAYLHPGDHMTYYEIDPAVERIARDAQYFSFLTKCPSELNVVLGDGRLTLARARDASYGLLILDAFSSDAIPTHLLSREAMHLYLSKLRDDGILAFHISNGFLDLEPVVARLADEAGLACVSRCDRGLPNSELADGQFAAHYVVMARNQESIAPLLERPRWNSCRVSRESPAWSDQYCDVVGAIRWGRESVTTVSAAHAAPVGQTDSGNNDANRSGTTRVQ